MVLNGQGRAFGCFEATGVLLAIATKLLCKLTNLFQVDQSKTFQVRLVKSWRILPATWSFSGLPWVFLPRYPAVYNLSVRMYGIAAKLLWWCSASTSSPTWIQPMQSRSKQILPNCTHQRTRQFSKWLCQFALCLVRWTIKISLLKLRPRMRWSQVGQSQRSYQKISSDSLNLVGPIQEKFAQMRNVGQALDWAIPWSISSIPKIPTQKKLPTYSTVHKMVLRREHEACVAKVL